MSAPESGVAGRLISLDALRGFDMFWLIGVDDLIQTIHRVWPTTAFGFVAAQFDHREWEGFTFYDLIFPLFIFLVGVSTVFSLTKTLAKGGATAARVRILRRFFLLFLVAQVYSGSLWQGHIRWIGVLQRIAWCYLFASLLFCHLRLRGLVVVFIGILAGYWALLTFVPPPGEPAPTFAMHRNWANYIDRHYLPHADMESRGWRNEGILSTVPAVATCLLGVFAGLLLKDRRTSDMTKVISLIIAGIAMVALGFVWGLQFPVIKRIWTSSYVLVAGGYSCLLLGLFYLVIDVYKRRAWATPFVWIGSNAITAYVLIGMVPWRLLLKPVVRLLESLLGEGAQVLAVGLVPACITLLMYVLHRRRLFLRL